MNAKTSVSSPRSRLNSTATSTVIRISKLIKPGSAMKLKFRMLSREPDAETGDDRARKGHHAADHRRDEGQ